MPDPFSTALRYAQNSQFVSVTTTSTPLLLSIPHLYKLSSYPVVIHVLLSRSTSSDVSAITALRQTGFAILHSTSIQEAQDLALISHALALSSSKGVIHFWESDQNDVPVSLERAETINALLKPMTFAEDVSPTHADTETIYLRERGEPIEVNDAQQQDIQWVWTRIKRHSSHPIDQRAVSPRARSRSHHE